MLKMKFLKGAQILIILIVCIGCSATKAGPTISEDEAIYANYKYFDDYFCRNHRWPHDINELKSASTSPKQGWYLNIFDSSSFTVHRDVEMEIQYIRARIFQNFPSALLVTLHLPALEKTASHFLQAELYN